MTLIRCFAVSKIVQIKKEEEEEVKEEIVTKAKMMQHFESDSRLKFNSNYKHSRKSRNWNQEQIASIPKVRLAVPVLLFMKGNIEHNKIFFIVFVTKYAEPPIINKLVKPKMDKL